VRKPFTVKKEGVDLVVWSKLPGNKIVKRKVTDLTEVTEMTEITEVTETTVLAS
jgi:hypothetical protein